MWRRSGLLFSMALVLMAVSSAGDDVTAGRHARHLPRPGGSTPGEVAVYVHVHLLEPGDRLQDGPEGTELDLDASTLLIWVDKEPQNRFVHPTAYVLVSGRGVKVVDGQWWPVLNGRPIIVGKQNHGTIVSPCSIPSGESERVLAHFLPEELGAGDVLADGDEVIATMTGSTFLVWVDMLPQAFFTHPTVYILVTADKRVIVRNGGWWPVLNGKRILHGSAGAYGVASPFWLR